MTLSTRHARPRRLSRRLRASAAGVALTQLFGCSTILEPYSNAPQGMLPPPLFGAPEAGDSTAAGAAVPQARSDRRTVVGDTPQVPNTARTSSIKPGTPAPAGNEPADTTLAFDQVALPTFIQIVFGTILKKTFIADPAVMTRSDVVTLRTGTPQTASQVLETTRLLLKGYGIAVNDLGAGNYRIAPDTNQGAYLPEIRRGRAQPDVPLPLRPVFNLVEMVAVKHTDVSNWLKAMFGAKLNVQEDATRNALLISGQASDVTAALEAIQVLDQPLMRGRSSQLLTPGTLSADDLAKRLVDLLGAEGYAAAVGPGPGAPISLLPIPASNALIVFANDAAVLAHVMAWATKLDSLENDNRRSGNYFSYEVKYADAQSLAKTMQELLGAQAAASQESTQVAPGMRVIGATVQKQPGRIVVNAPTNTLIFSTNSPEDYSQLLGIMKTLDKPSKSALIEVTVAEVRLTDAIQLGIEWGTDATAGTGTGTGTRGGTLGGLGLGTGGLALAYLNSASQVRSRLNALSSENKARILSSPRVMARNGESATVQVGQEVPIITSQQSTGTATSNTAGTVLQTIQYRSTGVILKVKPVIFAGNRVELDVQQEVSSASSTQTGVSASPTFTTRKVDTKLSIRDGATVALAGLISRTESSGSSGIPGFRDVPVAGQLFRSNTKNNDQTELIILITPYVIESDMVAEQVTQAMRGQLGAWAQQSAPTPTNLKPRPVEPVPAPVPAAVPVPEPSVPAPVPAPASAAAPPPDAPKVGEPVANPPLADLPAGRPVTDPVILEAIRQAAKNQPPAASKGSTGPAAATPAKKTPKNNSQ